MTRKQAEKRAEQMAERTYRRLLRSRREFLVDSGGFALGGACVLTGVLWRVAAPAQTPSPSARRRVVLVWSEGSAPKAVYPNDIAAAVAAGLANLPGWEVRTAGMDDPEQGLSQSALDAADVLVWWGHTKHGQIPDATVERIVRRVRDGGMGFVSLHSAHQAKPFRALLGGASGNWPGGATDDGKPNRITVADKSHPVAYGIAPFTIPKEERYGGKLDVPEPDTVVFGGVYEGNNTEGMQGAAWSVGRGRVFYFRPGHETYPVYFQPEVRRVIRNAVLWAGQDAAGLREDNDPGARAARGAQEPPLAEILTKIGYGGTVVTASSEVKAPRFRKAGSGPVTYRPVAAYGVLEVCRAGWYLPAGPAAPNRPARRFELWRVDGPNNKRLSPPLASGARTTFDPGDRDFGLWVATAGFPGEVIHTDDVFQGFISRFKDKPHKAHVYPAVRDNGAPVPNAYLIGWEYSTNDDNQDIVTLVENVQPA